MDKENYSAIIGVEIHLQPETKSKMFCDCPIPKRESNPNTVTCPICLGMPGSLPTLNNEALRKALRLSQELNCQINDTLQFDRKHYFYPDLPKGYQITQHDVPVGFSGFLEVEGVKVRIRRVHLEEDTAKLSHSPTGSKLDFNRSGLPLIEIVSEPDLRSGEQAEMFLRKLHQRIVDRGISKAEMAEGTMRLEPNISVGLKDEVEKGNLPSYKVEIKNINSFRFVRKAIDFEIERQLELIVHGQTVEQETRGWDEKLSQTVSQRSKEDSHDYRYFPEPDLPPVRVDEALVKSLAVDDVGQTLSTVEDYQKEFGISAEDAQILSKTRSVLNGDDLVGYVRKAITDDLPASRVVKLVINKPGLIMTVPPEDLSSWLKLQEEGKITRESELDEIVRETLAEEDKVVQQFLSGKDTALHYLVGQVMRKSGGKADAKVVEGILRSVLRDFTPLRPALSVERAGLRRGTEGKHKWS